MRKGISMIELVIAIVVMGIVVASVPMVLTQTNDNVAFTLKQEAIMAAKTRIGDIMTYNWDESSYDALNDVSYILDTNTPNANLNDRNGTVLIGGVIGSGRRRLSPTGLTASNALGDDAGDLDDVDDFDDTNVQVGTSAVLVAGVGAGATGSLDYIFDADMNITTTVTYATDNANYSQRVINNFVFNPADVGDANSRNIKTITETITGLEGGDITLRAFVANIGQSKPLLPRNFNP